MDAIESLGGRVTVGDVAGKAGLQLSEAHIALQALATDSNGFLKVKFLILFLCFEMLMLLILHIVTSI